MLTFEIHQVAPFRKVALAEGDETKLEEAAKQQPDLRNSIPSASIKVGNRGGFNQQSYVGFSQNHRPKQWNDRWEKSPDIWSESQMDVPATSSTLRGSRD